MGKVFSLCLASIFALVISCGENYANNSLNVENIKDAAKDFVKSEDFQSVTESLKKYFQAVVLLRTFSDKATEDGLIRNSALNPRDSKHMYNKGVTNGVVISPDGYIVANYNSVKNSSMILVSINSEKRKNTATDQMIITSDDRKARIVKEFPELNIVILKIDQIHKNEEFRYIEIGNIEKLKSSEGGFDSGYTIGKAVGENFVTPNKSANSNNSFDVVAVPVKSIILENIDGAEYLVLKNNITGWCVFPENDGGAVVYEGKLLGVVDYRATKSVFFSKELAIPANVVRRAVNMAVPGLLAKHVEVDLGMNVKDLKEDALGIKKDKVFGILVESLEKGSIADKHGIMPGDVILKFNSSFLKNVRSFQNMLNRSIGDSIVSLTILRNEKLIEIEIIR